MHLAGQASTGPGARQGLVLESCAAVAAVTVITVITTHREPRRSQALYTAEQDPRSQNNTSKQHDKIGNTSESNHCNLSASMLMFKGTTLVQHGPHCVGYRH